MALNDFETSRSLGQPVELYKVQYGESTAHYLTDAETAIEYGGDTYTPSPIERDKIVSVGRPTLDQVAVKVPLSSPLAELFRGYPPSRIVTIIIRQGHISDALTPAGWATGENFPVVFSGRIAESIREDNDCTLTCEHISAGMSRPGLRRHYQWSCPLALYGPRCQASKVAASTAVTAATVGSNSVVLTTGWQAAGRAGGDYLGGLLEWTGSLGQEQRTILNVSADTLTLDGPLTDLSDGGSATAVLGCPHTLLGCETIHANTQNYGGHPFIPVATNPIGKNNHT